MSELKLIENKNILSPIGFIEKYAVDPLTDRPVKLLKWQKKLIRSMYSSVGVIRVPNWFAFGAKKTGKSALAAMLTAYRMCHNKKELYVVIASNEAQAFLIYRAFIELFETAPWFNELKILINSITHKRNKTELRVLTRSVASTHGVRPSLLLVDELMSFDDNNFQQLSTLEASMTLARNPQKFFLSNVPLFSDHKSLELLKQYKKDSDWQITEFSADPKCDWKDKKNWECNPFYKHFPQVKANYEKDFERAKIDKQSEITFKRYNLGLGCVLDDNRWIDPEDLRWVKNKKERDEILNDKSLVWTCGWDISLRGSDSTSWVLAGWSPADDNDPLVDRKLFLYGKIFYGNIKYKKSLIRDKIRNWHLQKQVSWQNTVECVEPGPILETFYRFIKKYPHIKTDLINIFDPAFSLPYRQELSLEGFVSKTTTYSPKFMTNPIRRLQRLSELKGIYILEKENEAIKWQASCGYVNELSRNWCMLNRMNKSPQLNVDYWSASLLALSELLIPRRKAVIGVF